MYDCLGLDYMICLTLSVYVSSLVLITCLTFSISFFFSILHCITPVYEEMTWKP